MATTIITKYGSGAPTASDVVRGELAVDTENKRLYTEDSGGSVVELGTNPAANVTFGDNVKAVFGADSDLQIYHNGSDSFITDNGTGDLKISGEAQIKLGSVGGEFYATFNNNSSVNLYYDNAQKLATTSTGVDVTGTVTADGLTVDTTTLVVDATNDRVGIGTASPATVTEIVDANPVLQIRDSNTSAGSASTTIRMGESGSGGAIENYWDIKVDGANSGRLEFIDNWSAGGGTGTRMVIDDSGNVGIGTDSPGAKLEVSNGSDSDLVMVVRGADNTTEYMALGVNGANGVLTAGASGAESTNMVFRTASSGTEAEAMRIDSSGRVLVGTSSVDGDGLSIKPRVSGGGTTTQLLFNRANSTETGFALVFYNNSTLVGSISHTNSATSFNTSSDQRLKENIVDAPSASDDIDAIQVRSFDWKADGSHQKYGMVAQELVTVAPEAVSQPEDPEEMMGVDYGKLVPMLIKEVQQLRARVAQLEGAN